MENDLKAMTNSITSSMVRKVTWCTVVTSNERKSQRFRRSRGVALTPWSSQLTRVDTDKGD